MKRILFVILVSFLFCSTTVISNKPYSASAEVLCDSGIDYSESLSAISNPDRGSFKLEQYAVCDSANVSGNGTVEHFKKYLDGKNYPSGNTLFLLSFGLEYYSSNMGGTDKDITANGIEYIKNTIANCIEAGANVILRFSYDAHGVSYEDGKRNCEPEKMEQVLNHVRQLSVVVSGFSANVTALQSSMLGPWGEQHTTTLGSDGNAENYYSLIETWLNNTPDDMWIQVRRPKYFLHWYNAKYKTSYTTENMTTINVVDAKAKRICCYNDGYLASDSDWGTYTHRESETKWLNSLVYAPFGGEVCSELDNGELGAYNRTEYVENEAFVTHTSFLNYEYDYENVIKLWEKQTYVGKDVAYSGKTSGFTYVFNHLGYRLVLRQSMISDSVLVGGTLKIRGKIENVGFGNVTREQVAKIIVTDGDGRIVLNKNAGIDAKSFLSCKTVDYSAEIDIKDLQTGKYKAYLAFNGVNQFGKGVRSIRFANKNVFDESLGANYIGSFSVADSGETSSSSEIQSSSGQNVKSSNNSVRSDSDKSPATWDGSSESAVSSEYSTKQKRGCSSAISAGNTALFAICLAVLAIALFKLRKIG